MAVGGVFLVNFCYFLSHDNSFLVVVLLFVVIVLYVGPIAKKQQKVKCKKIKKMSGFWQLGFFCTKTKRKKEKKKKA